MGGEEHIMNGMDQDRVGDKLDPLWAAYRDACPDLEPGAPVELDVRGQKLMGQVVKGPFVKR